MAYGGLLVMKNLAKNTTYIVVINKGRDSFNWYCKVANAYKITNAKRKYLNVEDETVKLYTSGEQVASEFLNRIGFIVPYRLSEAQNLVVIENQVNYKQLKS